MDIYCPVCGEPWDNDTLHDYAEEFDSTYEKVWHSFRDNGCGVAFAEWKIISCVKRNNMRTTYMSALSEIMGDDVDGIMSMMEDAEYLGMMD